MIGLESSGDVFNVTGSVTNNSGALFALTGGSSATFSSTLLNNGQVDAENASSLTVNGATTNNGTLSTSGFGGTGGNTMTFTALLTNNGGAQITVNGSTTRSRLSRNRQRRTITVKNGSTIDPPFFNNLGTLNIDGTSTFVVGTGTRSGTGLHSTGQRNLGEMINSAPQLRRRQLSPDTARWMAPSIFFCSADTIRRSAQPTTSSCSAPDGLTGTYLPPSSIPDLQRRYRNLDGQLQQH